eukprot:366157-Chlamydomonas_euryale.AAC.20
MLFQAPRLVFKIEAMRALLSRHFNMVKATLDQVRKCDSGCLCLKIHARLQPCGSALKKPLGMAQENRMN